MFHDFPAANFPFSSHVAFFRKQKKSFAGNSVEFLWGGHSFSQLGVKRFTGGKKMSRVCVGNVQWEELSVRVRGDYKTVLLLN